MNNTDQKGSEPRELPVEVQEKERGLPDGSRRFRYKLRPAEMSRWRNIRRRWPKMRRDLVKLASAPRGAIERRSAKR